MWNDGSGVQDLKARAKRLREHLQNKNIQLSHSEALEAVSAMYGFKDWNTASKSPGIEANVYVINCFADEDQEDPDLTATFQYLVKAQNKDAAVEALVSHLSRISAPTKTGFFPTEFYTEDIIEMNLPIGDGIPINMRIDYGDHLISLPYGGRKGVTIRRTEFDESEDIPSSLDEKDMEQVLVLEHLQSDSEYGDEGILAPMEEAP